MVEVEVVKTNNGRPIESSDAYILSYVVALSRDDLLANRFVDSSEWYSDHLITRNSDESLLPGLRSAIQGCRYGDTLVVTLLTDEAYGKRGIPGRVPPNASLYIQVEIAGIR